MHVTKDDIKDGIGIVDLLVLSKLTPSKSEARRVVQQGGASVNEKKITDLKAVIQPSEFKDGGILIKKGKKSFVKMIID